MVADNDAQFSYRALCRLFVLDPKECKIGLQLSITAKNYENNKPSIENVQPQRFMFIGRAYIKSSQGKGEIGR
jgi:hypothetical protein